MLCGEGLSKKYNDTWVLREASIVVGSGGVTVLLGQSGSGKSTLLRLLSLVDEPFSGSIRLGDYQIYPAVSRGAVAPLWPDVTVVFQQFALWPHVTLSQNILLPSKLRSRSVSQFRVLCEELGIQDLLSRYPSQVSVGQRQRVALARAILLRPRFLLLDEVTSAQDVQHVALILDVLRSAVSDGLGLLVVTHHLGFARQILSMVQEPRVVFLESGSVAESGGADLLVTPKSGALQRYLTLSKMLA